MKVKSMQISLKMSEKQMNENTMINYNGSGYFSQCMYIMQVDKNEHTRVVLELSTLHDQAVKSKHILYTVHIIRVWLD
jgi:hypothetical protein